MSIIRFLFKTLVLFIGVGILSEYLQLIDLHPKFPPNEKQKTSKETLPMEEKEDVKRIPKIEVDDIVVKDVPSQKTEMVKEKRELVVEDVDVKEKEEIKEKEVAIKVQKINPPEGSPEYAPKDVVPFGIRFKNYVSYFNVFGVYLLPEEIFTFKTESSGTVTKVKAVASKGKLSSKDQQSWSWKAPKESGLYSILLTAVGVTESMKINCWVMTPITEPKEVIINDFKIGTYPHPKREEYAAPKGFIEVNKRTENAYVSPNFQVKEFLSNQAGKWKYPNYVYLDEALLIKLELVLAAVNNSGIPCDKFAVLSGYRTPYYNTLKDNKEYSRHQFGKAADIYIDNDNDGWMDDLNGDGKRSSVDAQVLYDLIDGFQKQDWYKDFVGGMGFYEQNTSRTSFLHLDVRTRKIPIRW